MTGWSGDLRYAWRRLRKSPGFAATAVLTLVLGIGANTAVFQLLAAVRLRSLPVEKPQELAEVKLVGGCGEKSGRDNRPFLQYWPGAQTRDTWGREAPCGPLTGFG